MYSSSELNPPFSRHPRECGDPVFFVFFTVKYMDPRIREDDDPGGVLCIFIRGEYIGKALILQNQSANKIAPRDFALDEE